MSAARCSLATGLVALALVACLLVPTVWGLAIAIGATGVAGAVWGLARQAYLSEAVPIEMRARALSTLGGVQRIGSFIGPFLGAFAMRFLGTDGAYWVHLVAAVLACGVLVSLPDVESVRRTRGSRPVAAQSTWAVIRDTCRCLRTLGVGALLVGAVRASRQVVIPLWALHIGLDPQTTSIIFGLSGAVDMLLFYPAGSVMDRLGRKWVAVPSMFVLGLAHLLLPLTHSTVTLTAVAMLMGVGNGLGRRRDHDAGRRRVSTGRPGPVPGRVPAVRRHRQRRRAVAAGRGHRPARARPRDRDHGRDRLGRRGRHAPVDPAASDPGSARLIGTDLVPASRSGTMNSAEDRWSLLPE